LAAVICGFCEEPIEAGERGRGFGTPLHRESQIRLVVGSVAHIERRCGCYLAGSSETDPPHMTLREAARAALRAHIVRQARN
jgi:hypothetical protein